MSDAARDWHLYLVDMQRFAEKVLAYTLELDQTRFVASPLH